MVSKGLAKYSKCDNQPRLGTLSTGHTRARKAELERSRRPRACEHERDKEPTSSVTVLPGRATLRR